MGHLLVFGNPINSNIIQQKMKKKKKEEKPQKIPTKEKFLQTSKYSINGTF